MDMLGRWGEGSGAPIKKTTMQRWWKLYAYGNILSWLTLLHMENNFHSGPASGENWKRGVPYCWVRAPFPWCLCPPSGDWWGSVWQSICCVSWSQVLRTSACFLNDFTCHDEPKGVIVIPPEMLVPDAMCVLVTASSWTHVWGAYDVRDQVLGDTMSSLEGTVVVI